MQPGAILQTSEINDDSSPVIHMQECVVVLRSIMSITVTVVIVLVLIRPGHVATWLSQRTEQGATTHPQPHNLDPRRDATSGKLVTRHLVSTRLYPCCLRSIPRYPPGSHLGTTPPINTS